MELQLDGKTVLITGANNPLGIGAATALAFCREGANVAIVYKRLHLPFDEQKAGQYGTDWYYKRLTEDAGAVEQSLRAANANYLVVEADISLPAEVSSAYTLVEERFGQVDILVNNAAAYDEQDTIFTIAASGIDKTFGVNVKGSLLMIHEFVARFQARNGASGRIINLSTDAAQNFAGQIAYGASKAAIEAFTRSIAREVGHLGITINTVAPGPTQTGYIDEDAERALIPHIPLGRLGTGQDIANLIVFLASAKADWITGQVIKVSGGHAL
jgi:3-oxoacyl-[acyl-carrier protein] reductase